MGTKSKRKIKSEDFFNYIITRLPKTYNIQPNENKHILNITDDKGHKIELIGIDEESRYHMLENGDVGEQIKLYIKRKANENIYTILIPVNNSELQQVADTKWFQDRKNFAQTRLITAKTNAKRLNKLYELNKVQVTSIVDKIDLLQRFDGKQINYFRAEKFVDSENEERDYIREIEQINNPESEMNQEQLEIIVNNNRPHHKGIIVPTERNKYLNQMVNQYLDNKHQQLKLFNYIPTKK